ncbi:unnamed protein product [Lactuca saligna]|uniref:Uncharacterized protein n=1 Tax=Lactuca saligna TaxID=75948 RepID=A0AA36E4Q3_LACSI|nr:unnamed protein product [Lactuca saligna]
MVFRNPLQLQNKGEKQRRFLVKKIKKSPGGSDEHKQKPPKSKDLKDNVASASKGKEKLVDDDDEEEEEDDDDENEKLKCKSRDAEIDENLFDKIAITSLPDHGVDQVLFSFYLKNVKPQYQTWSSKKITVVNVFRPVETESFINTRFKVARGATSFVFEFTLADFTYLNPFDWIYLLHLLLKYEQKFEPIVAHLKRMLVCYIQEIGKMYVEIATVLRKKPTVLPKEPLKDLDKMKLGRIRKDDWSMAFQIQENFDDNFHRVFFFLPDKHLYSTPCLEYILEFSAKQTVLGTSNAFQI